MSHVLRVFNRDSWVDDGENYCRVWGRTADGEAHYVDIGGYPPYFYAPTDEVKRLDTQLAMEEDVHSVEHGHTSVYGDPVSRVYMTNSRAVSDIREMFTRHFDAMTFFHDRVWIDLDLRTGIEVPDVDGKVDFRDVKPVEAPDVDPRVLTVDIEVDDRGTFPAWEDPNRAILSIVAHDSYADLTVGWLNTADTPGIDNGVDIEGLDTIFQFGNEYRMLQHFIETIDETDPDILTGWNFCHLPQSKGFDLPYLINRAKRVGVDIWSLSRNMPYKKVDADRYGKTLLTGRTPYDLLEAYSTRKRQKQPSYTLDNTAQREAGKEKIKFLGSYWDLYQDDPVKFMEYNARDVELCLAIDDAVNIISFKQGIMDTHGCRMEETYYPKDFYPITVKRKAHKKGVALPSDTRGDKEAKGGFVLPASSGVAENVVELDLASLYPNNISMGNLSPETKLTETDAMLYETMGKPVFHAPNGTHWRLDKTGIIAELADESLDAKATYKLRKSELTPGTPLYNKVAETYDVVKAAQVNSLYGLTLYKYFFWFDYDVGATCTAMGRECIQRTRDYINANSDGVVLYGDTDSCYVQFPVNMDRETVMQKAVELAEEINQVFYPKLCEEFGIPAERNRWEIEPGTYISRFFQAGSKKHYAKLEVAEYAGNGEWNYHEEPEVGLKGFQAKKSNTAPVTADLQTSIIEAILFGKGDQEIIRMVHEAAQEIQESQYDRIGIPGGIGKEIPTSKDEGDRLGGSDGTHYAWSTNKRGPRNKPARAAYNANQLMGKNFGQGDKPKMLYLDPARSAGLDCIAFEEPEDLKGYGRELYLDIPEMVDRLVVSPNEDILQVFGIDAQAAVDGQTQSGLGDWC